MILHLPHVQIKSKENGSKVETSNTQNIHSFSELTEPNTSLKIDDYVSENSSESNENMKDLVETNKKLNKIIKQLQNEITAQKTTSNFFAIDNNNLYMNINLIDVKGNSFISKKTDIACWWCTHNFDNLPYFIVDRYDGIENNGKEKYGVFGCFCTINCALAYNIEMGDNKVNNRYSLTKQLYSSIFENNEKILIAPRKEILTKYGGIFTIEEYRKNLNGGKINYKIQMPPVYYIVPKIDEIKDYNNSGNGCGNKK